METLNAFNDIPNAGLPQASGIAGQQYLDNILAMQVGSGTSVFRADQSGFWLGANKFADAPFRVDMQGNVYIITATGGLIFDAINNRIIVNDGTNDRVLIGYLQNGF
jgi:hypothetical protein